MSNLDKRQVDIQALHPALRSKIQSIQDVLLKENLPFRVLEAFRTPLRQQHLFAQGHTSWKRRDKSRSVGRWCINWFGRRGPAGGEV
jgi:peptidoglycan L-alanyl-D-glutamate endopeptidase CwlK